MYLRKIVDSTVDKLTLSYTEKHLKEALDSESAIPTTVLSIIAENSFNEYNMKSISTFLNKSFRLDYKEWKRFRNLLKIIEYLLKFGSNEFITLAKQYSSNVRGLQNYSFTEGGVDRGSGIRENALMILGLLNNARELDMFREESRRHREKYTGISSDSSGNQGYAGSTYGNPGYKGPGYENPSSGYGNSTSGYGNQNNFGYSHSGYGQSDLKGQKSEGFLYREDQKKTAESIFGSKIETREENKDIFRSESKRSQNEGFSTNFERDPQSSHSKNSDIFKIQEKGVSKNPPDLFSEGKADIFSVKKTPDLFNSKQEAPEAFRNDDTRLLKSGNFSKPGEVDLFSVKSRDLLDTQTEQSSFKQQEDLFSKVSVNTKPQSLSLFSSTNLKQQPSSFNSTNLKQQPSSNLTSTNPNPQNLSLFDPIHTNLNPQHPNLFNSTPSTLKPQQTDLFDLAPINLTAKPQQSSFLNSAPSQKSENPTSLFSGMTQKRQSEPVPQPVSLESLSLTFAPSPVQAVPKFKSNLIQVEEKKIPEPVKKTFNPSEFEEKLFSLDFK